MWEGLQRDTYIRQSGSLGAIGKVATLLGISKVQPRLKSISSGALGAEILPLSLLSSKEDPLWEIPLLTEVKIETPGFNSILDALGRG